MAVGRDTVVVVGGGLAGAKAADGAREAGFDGRVVVVGDEGGLPYERPPLSKAILRGEAGAESAHVHPAAHYRDIDIELLTGRTVTALDVDSRTVRLDDGTEIAFTAAVLATGAEPRRVPIPGADLDGVHYLRSLDDALRLRDAIRGAGRVAIVGAGWIGSEVAASARQMGADVVMIDNQPTPLHRVLGRMIGETLAALHTEHGVHLRMGTGVAELRGSGSVDAVGLTDGTVETADLVVVAVGVKPRLELAEAAGLAVGDGVLTDEHLCTSAPGVYAAGDIAAAWNPHYQTRLRVEHWANAAHQGTTAGANAVGAGVAYDRLPYFFSDQYDLGFEYVGNHDPTDELAVRGSLAERRFVAFWHRGGVLTGAIAVNTRDVVEDLRAMLLRPGRVDVRRLVDLDVSLDSQA